MVNKSTNTSSSPRIDTPKLSETNMPVNNSVGPWAAISGRLAKGNVPLPSPADGSAM